MLDKIKNAIRGENKEQKKQPIQKKNYVNNFFGGETLAQKQSRIENFGKEASSSLSTAKIGENAKEALALLSDITEPKKISTSIPYANKLEEIAAFYSEGNITVSVEKLKKHINENKGKVEQPYWYMLLDCYEILNQKENFENTAIVYAKSCNASPPSWNNKQQSKNNMITGKNIIILPEIFTNDFTVIFKDFLKAARKEKFCRINISQCKFERSTMTPLEKFYQLMVNIKKYKINAILMGENNLIDFCHKIINNEIKDKEFEGQEQFFSLLYLEILQWKGKRDEFEEKTIEYVNQFNMSAPEWSEDSIMLHQPNNDIKEEENNLLNINEGNIQLLIENIKKDFSYSLNSTIDFSNIQYIDFYSLGILTQFIQEIKNEDKNLNKNIIFKYPNEMMNVLFKMIGLSEFIQIIPKVR